MIFATVGTQLPFPRLIQALDDLAGELKLKIVAQTCAATYAAENLQAHPSLGPHDFDQHFRMAEIVVAHAGIGTVLSAQRFEKPLIVMPRLASLGEHRNEHQLATIKQVEKLPGIYAAYDKNDLRRLLTSGPLPSASQRQSETRNALILKLEAYIAES